MDEQLLRLFDIVGATLIISGIYLAPKTKSGWLMYLLGNVCLLVVIVANRLVGLTAMGVILSGIALRNYLRKEN